MTQKKILHFEDEQMLADIYREKFTDHGFNYKNYKHPPKTKDELVRLVMTENPDLIIMDMIMPVLDGFKAVKYLKEDDRTKNIFIIGLSNIGQQEDIEKLKDYGIDDYIVCSTSTPSGIISTVEIFFNNRKRYTSSFGTHIKVNDV